MLDVLPAAAADALIASESPVAVRSMALAHASSSDEGDGRRLTDRQQLFVLAYTSESGAIGCASEAARRAGYSEKNAGEIGRQLLGKQHIVDAIRESNRDQISGKMATKAIALLGRVIEDESVSMKVRVDAARSILDRAGFGALPPAPPKRLTDKAISEMTGAELRETMRLAKAEMDRAKVVNHVASKADPLPPRTPNLGES